MRTTVGYAYLGNGVGVTNTHRGHRIFVYTRDKGLSPHIIMSGVWEWGVEHAILKLIDTGSTVVEVGCNMGYHTLAMCEKIGPEGCLYGFEANPELFTLLKWSLDHNGFFPRAKIFNHAVTQILGDVKFTFDPNAVGGGHVFSDNNSAQEVITVKGIPLDQTLSHIPKIDLLRMDVEGFEPFVIRGATKLLKRSPDLIIVAEWSVSMMSARVDLQSFLNELDAEGFRAWRITGDSKFESVPMTDLISLPHCELAFSRYSMDKYNSK